MQNAAWSFSSAARRFTGQDPSSEAEGGAVERLFASDFAPEVLAERVLFEVEDDSPEEAEIALIARAGKEWAEAEKWDALADYITQADRSRAKTRAGLRHRGILQTGALSLLDTPLASGDEEGAREALAAFQMAQSKAPRCPVRAALAARANLGIAWSIRGERPASEIHQEDRMGIEARVERAEGILAPFAALGGAILGEARYRTHVLGGDIVHDLPLLYAAWAQADPEDATPMETHGFYLTPRWGGSFEAIELEARRAALRTEDTVGFAGYAMLTTPLLADHPALMAHLDPALFVEGIDDWLATAPETGRVNRVLRRVVDALNVVLPDLGENAELAAASFRSYLAEQLPRLIDAHLRLADLSAWDDQPDWLRSVIAYAYADHLSTGGTVRLTAQGAHRDPAAP